MTHYPPPVGSRWLPAMNGLSFGGSAARHRPGHGCRWLLPAKPRHAGCGLIPFPRYQPMLADDVDGGERWPPNWISQVRLVAQAQLSEMPGGRRRRFPLLTYRPARPRPRLPQRACSGGKPFRGRAGNPCPGGPQPARGLASHRRADVGWRRMNTAGHAVTPLGQRSASARNTTGGRCA